MPWILIIVVFIFIYYYAMKQMMNNGGPAGKISSFGKAHVRMPSDDKNKITFRDVAGADEEKAELVEIVDYLKAPEQTMSRARKDTRVIRSFLFM